MANQVTLTNETPLSLRIDVGRQGMTLQPWGSDTVASDASVQLVDVKSGCRVGSVSLDGEAKRSITIDQLQVTPGAQEIDVTVLNKTAYYASITDRTGDKTKKPLVVAPGDEARIRARSGSLLEFRHTFTNQLVGLYVCSNQAADQSAVIDDAFATARSAAAPPLSLVPNLPKPPKLVGEPGAKPTPESRSYVSVSAYEYGTRAAFNGQDRVVTRIVRIAGVKLIFDDADTCGLKAWSNPQVTDLERVEIIADHVVVATPIRFAGADVSISARVLEFTDRRSGDASTISTTPVERATPATSPMTADGRYPANPDGTPSYVCANGKDGESGGSITLAVRNLIVPPKGTSTVRFITKGGAGQKAQPGGIKPYRKNQDGQPAGGKDLPAVDQAAIGKKIKAVMTFATNCWNWRWPGPGKEVDWPTQVSWNGRTLFDENPGHVSHLRLVALDRGIASTDINVMFFPSGERENINGFNITTKLPQKTQNIRPGDGEDAYPGGKPGRGGNGGDIPATVATGIAALVDMSGGKAGETTPLVKGLPAGKPNPAYSVTLCIVKKTPPIQAWAIPWISVEDVSGKDGKTFDAISNGEGSKGNLTALTKANPVMGSDGCVRLPTGHVSLWVDVVAIDAVLSCAKDMFRSGYRQPARSLIDPYYAEMSSTEQLSADLAARLVSISAMRENLINDLDYFGHPAGWVPRLRADTNFTLYRDTRKASTDLLLFARAQLSAFEARAAVVLNTSEISAKLSDDIDRRRGEIARGYNELTEARATLAAVEADVEEAAREMENLRTWVADECKDKVEAQRIFKGVMKLAGAAMKIIPYGQPYLGLAGDVTAGVGDFDWNKKGAGGQWNDILKGVGGKVDSFLTDNKDLIVKDIVNPADPRAADRSLEDRLTAARGELKVEESRQKDVKDAFEDKWKSGRQGYLDGLKKDMTELDVQITALKAKAAPTEAEKQARMDKEEEESRLRKAVGYAETASILELRKSYADQIDELEKGIAKAQAAKNAAADARLKTDKEKIAGYDKKIAGLETEKRDAETASKRRQEDEEKKGSDTKDAIDRLKGLGDGIGLIGQGIAILATPVTRDDPEVQAIVADILDTSKDIEIPDERRDQYRKLIKKLKSIQTTQQESLRRLLVCQQTIAQHTSAVAQGLTALSDLAHRSQIISDAQDIRLKRYLQDMATRARDAMQQAVYHFVMAFRYEFLMDVPKELQDVDSIIDAIAKAALVDEKGNAKLGDNGKPLTFATIPPADYAKAEEKVLQDILLNAANALVARRQERNPPKTRDLRTPAPMMTALKPPTQPSLAKWAARSANWLEALRRDRVVWLHPVTDLKLVPDFWTRGLRIRGVTLENVKLDVGDDRGDSFDFDLRFVHSGVSVVYDKSASGEAEYYYFRKGPNDDPMSWNFRCAWNRGDKGSTVTWEGDKMAEDTMISLLMNTDKLELKQYAPGLYSPLGLALVYTLSKKRDAFPVIRELKFSVQVEHTGDPPVAGAL